VRALFFAPVLPRGNGAPWHGDAVRVLGGFRSIVFPISGRVAGKPGSVPAGCHGGGAWLHATRAHRFSERVFPMLFLFRTSGSPDQGFSGKGRREDAPGARCPGGPGTCSHPGRPDRHRGTIRNSCRCKTRPCCPRNRCCTHRTTGIRSPPATRILSRITLPAAPQGGYGASGPHTRRSRGMLP
jgi:hypothetical protein